ncbi:LLM class F420-dependent oxidoreductase [Prauserella marina]|uniref:Probable F420-dependent oxidoreductase, Rv2161c family n=1 Tax=Prauserella marina TaxID=530584 RepID=A0A222VUZ0_9PSEU|nr:LLM class flavin-dependent oxidoreductase [Prauserella marina]ASR37738.1 LLM class F420-dependent oxidoreductase [Prauserella marina]PWV75685.1 putative F420-dependent oxidoreductase [Prauserella marina]SDD28797.1 probable F420-dependent oxidoreductase, Rv2161c family [Prauserella marina]
MRFGFAIPQFFADGEFDPDGFARSVRRIEELGFHSAWTLEQPLGSMPCLSPLDTMTFAAAHTSTLRLGCAVFVTTLHNPVHLAKSLSTVDQLSKGRLDVGVGTGGKGRMFSAFGVDGDRYASRFAEGIDLMKALWTEDRTDFDGEFWQLAEAGMEPKPLQKPHPPLWFGGASPSALRRAVRMGDGFIGAGSTPTATFAEQVGIIRAAPGGESGFPIAKRVYLAVDDQPARARQRMNERLADVYGRRVATIESAAITGTADECAEALRDVGEAGAELIIITPLFDHEFHLEKLVADVLPSLT